MKRFNFKIVGMLFLAATILGGCQEKSFMEPISKDSNDVRGSIENVQDYVPGVAIIKLNPNDQATSLRSIENALSGSLRSVSKTKVRLEHVFYIGGPYEKVQREAGLHLWMKASFDETADLSKVFDTLKQNPNISEVDGMVRVCPESTVYQPVNSYGLRMANSTQYNSGYSAFNSPDPYLPMQWHYRNEGSGTEFLNGADINLFDAWKVETGKKNVVVAILDSGIEATHEDLVDNMWHDPNTGSYGYNFYSNTSTVEPGFHGTHVAGTIAARNNNGVGVSGVAGGDGTPDSGVRLMSCQIFSKDEINDSNTTGATLEQIARAFQWAAEHGAVIANCSWGFKPSQAPNGVPDVLKKAIDYFIEKAGTDPQGNQLESSPMKGGVVIFAAGNDALRDQNVVPAFYERVIAVGSFTSNYVLANYSNTGDWVDVLAPGGLTPINHIHTGILSTISSLFPKINIGDGVHGKDFLYPGNAMYAYAQGTSMATPHVTGIAALIASKYGKSGYTNEDLKKRLLRAVKPISPNDYNLPEYVGKIGRGYIDATLALEEESHTAPAKVAKVTDEVNYFTVKLSWKVTSDADAVSGAAYKYVITLTEKGKEPIKVDLLNSKKVGELIEHTFTKLTDGTTYKYEIVAHDMWGNASEPQTGSVTTLLNHAPEVVDLPASLLFSLEDAFKVVSFKVNDEDGHTWDLETKDLPKNIKTQKTDDGFDATFRMTVSAGDYSFNFALVDQLGKRKEYSIPYKIIKKYQPIRQKTNFDNMSLKIGTDIPMMDLSEMFDSPLELPLTFSVTSSHSDVVEASIVEGTKLSLVGHKEGVSKIEITVSDGLKSKVVSYTITISSTSDAKAGMYILYPIPTVDILNIQTQSSDNIEVVITTPRGQKVFEKILMVDKVSHIAKANIKSLTPGVYNVNIISGGTTTMRRIIKN